MPKTSLGFICKMTRKSDFSIEIYSFLAHSGTLGKLLVELTVVKTGLGMQAVYKVSLSNHWIF